MSKEEVEEKTKNDLIESAREEGEKAKAIETAKKMFKDKLPIESIIKYTGLSEKEIKNL